MMCCVLDKHSEVYLLTIVQEHKNIIIIIAIQRMYTCMHECVGGCAPALGRQAMTY